MATALQPNDGALGRAPSQTKEEAVFSHINDQGDAEGGKPEDLPSVLAPIEALGIDNWRDLEKKLVRRLDLTMMPCLWVSLAAHPSSLLFAWA